MEIKEGILEGGI